MAPGARGGGAAPGPLRDHPVAGGRLPGLPFPQKPGNCRLCSPCLTSPITPSVSPPRRLCAPACLLSCLLACTDTGAGVVLDSPSVPYFAARDCVIPKKIHPIHSASRPLPLWRPPCSNHGPRRLQDATHIRGMTFLGTRRKKNACCFDE